MEIPVEGTVLAGELIRVRAPFDGRIDKLRARPNAWVRRKAPLGFMQSGAVITLRGKGVPRLRSATRGDLHVHVEVRTPTNPVSVRMTVFVAISMTWTALFARSVTNTTPITGSSQTMSNDERGLPGNVMTVFSANNSLPKLGG